MSADPADDRVARLLERAERLSPTDPAEDAVEALLADSDALDDRDLIRFDERARTWAPRIRRAEPLWTLLGLVSPDGFEREAATREVRLRRSTVALIALRSVDWVPEVREAALNRLEAAPTAVLLDVLPMIDLLTRRRDRSHPLDRIVERRLTDGDLVAATQSPNAAARRAAWRRLIARGRCDAGTLGGRAVRDLDPLVRAMAAAQLDGADDESRRLIATTLVEDPLGWLAVKGLDALVELDGSSAIRLSLTAPNGVLRRRARDWAAIRDVDARAVYLERLRCDPTEALSLTALAEIGDRADRDILEVALCDERSRVRAAALGAFARLDATAVKDAALAEIAAGGSGRVVRAALAALRRVSLDDDDLDAIEAIARDDRRTDRDRLWALAILRPVRWRHLVAVLEVRRDARAELRDKLDNELRNWTVRSATLSRGPSDAQRQVVATLLATVDAPTRGSIDFILRTTR